MSDIAGRTRELRDRYDEILSSLSDPAVLSDRARYQKLSRELSELSPIIDTADRISRMEEELTSLREMVQEAGEDELRQMAREEALELEVSLQQLREDFFEQITPKDPNDRRSVIVEIRAGAGGEEAALFCGVLYRMYDVFAIKNGWRTEFIDASETELGGYKEIVFSVEGTGAYSRFKYESGVHRVQRVPVTESSGRVHTSTVTVAVLPEVEPVEVDMNPNDLRIDTFRASGAGGQHVNRTESAIRITHIPTGIIAQCQDERSQHKNRDKAMAVLMSRLLDRETQMRNGSLAQERKSQVGTGDRSERIRTYNYHQGRVTDHRIGLTLYRLEEILAGDLEEIVRALAVADKNHTIGSADDKEDE